MEGAMMLMLLTAFLAFIVYRMDQNQSKESESEDSDLYKQGYQNGYLQGMNCEQHKPIDVTPVTKAIRKKRK